MMPKPTALCLLLVACGGGSVNQGKDLDDDTAPNTDSVPGDDSSEGDSDTDSDADTDTDTDADGDTDWEGDCGNYYDPVDLVGWTKNYDVVHNGNTGTEVMQGWGKEGNVYRYDTNLITSAGDGYNGSVHVACDLGGQEGLFMLDWTVDYMSGGSPFGEVANTLDPPRMYLPDESVIGAVGSWSYDYAMQVSMAYSDTGGSFPMTIDVTGQYVERGEVQVDVGGQTVTGYHLVNTYTMSSQGLYGYGAFTREGTIDQVWVKGIGMVTEDHQAQLDTGVTSSIQKTLSSFTGIQIIDN